MTQRPSVAALPPRHLAFWFDFASTYSYLSALRIEALASAAGVEVVWRPFLLGPIFKAQGWDTSPFNLYPAKGRYMIRDLERLAAARGEVFHMPARFPANSLLAARTALALETAGALAAFCKAVFAAEFAQAKDIADEAVIVDILAGLGINPRQCLEKTQEPAIKQKLRERTEHAAALGIFGAPTFETRDGEIFWGDDRLEQALDFAQVTE